MKDVIDGDDHGIPFALNEGAKLRMRITRCYPQSSKAVSSQKRRQFGLDERLLEFLPVDRRSIWHQDNSAHSLGPYRISRICGTQQVMMAG